MPLFLQLGLGLSPAQAGMSMIPTAAGAMVSKLLAERLIGGLGYRRLLVGNTLALGLAMASFSLVDAQTPHAVTLAMLAVFGVINSLQFTAMNTLTLGDLGGQGASAGNSLLSVVMQLSMSLGVATGSALLMLFGGAGGGGVATRTAVQGTDVSVGAEAFHTAFVCVGLLTIVASAIFWQLGRGERRAAASGLHPGDG
jgi:predicted MFS family arabinose efflux permease